MIFLTLSLQGGGLAKVFPYFLSVSMQGHILFLLKQFTLFLKPLFLNISNSSLWIQMLRTKYLDSLDPERIFLSEETPFGFMTWKGLKKVRSHVLQFLKWDAGEGNKFYFW